MDADRRSDRVKLTTGTAEFEAFIVAALRVGLSHIFKKFS